MTGLPDDIHPEEYAAFVDHLRAYFEARRATAADGGAATGEESGPELDPALEADLLALFAQGDRPLDAHFAESLLEGLRALSPEGASPGRLPGWAEFVARCFRYEQDFLLDLEELELPEERKRALRRQMVQFFRALARQLSGPLPGGLELPTPLPEASDEPQEALLAALSDPVWITDSEGLIRYCNPALRQRCPAGIELLGTSAQQWLQWSETGSAADAVRSAELILAPGHRWPMQVTQVPQGEGRVVWLLREQWQPAAALAAAAAEGAEPLAAENLRLRSLYRAWLALGSTATEEELIPVFLNRLNEAVPYGAAALLLLDQQIPHLWTSLGSTELPEWEGLGGRLLEHYELFAHQPAPAATIRTHACGLTGSLVTPGALPPAEGLVLPLVAGDRVWGVLALYRADAGVWSSQEVQAIAILTHGLAATWRQLLTTRTIQRTHDHMQQELRFARRVQRNFLPQPAVHPEVRVVTRFVPASHLSGDFYLFDQPPGGPVTVLIGDVAGHGVPAALMMMAMVGIFTELLPHARDRFHELLPLANLACCQILEENYFVTVQALRIDPAKNELAYANAGHPPPLHLVEATGECKFLDSPGLPLGMFPDAIYTVRHIPCHPGDRLLGYTDGLVEVRDGSGQVFGRERLRELTAAQWKLPSSFLLDHLVAAAQSHAGRPSLPDDVALIAVDVLEG